MNEGKDLEELLKSISEGLKKYTVKELNDAIVSFFNKKDDKTKEIYYLLEIVSKEYETNISTLKKKNLRGDLSDAKQIAYCLLHFNLGLPTRYISEKIFKSKSHTVVHKAIIRFKNANVNLKPDKIFIEKYDKLSKEFIDTFAKQKKLEYEH